MTFGSAAISAPSISLLSHPDLYYDGRRFRGRVLLKQYLAPFIAFTLPFCTHYRLRVLFSGDMPI